jgi:hypothetical protein
MRAIKLTEKQQDLLGAMRNGVVCHYMRYMGRFNPNPYYFRNDTHARCTKQAERLLELGLVQKVDKNQFGDHRLIYKPTTLPASVQANEKGNE